MRQICIFSGSSHPALADAICERLGRKTDIVELRKFANGETSVEIKTSVRDKDVFIVQSGSGKINDNVMELLIMISACKGGSAKSITAVMPYFPYSRQSKKKSHRGAITARMVANLMHVAGVTHAITLDLHASQMQGFFKCPVDNLVAEPLLARWIKQNVRDWREAVVVSKNAGGTKRVTTLADAMKLSFGIVTTDRVRAGSQSMFNSVVLDGSVMMSPLKPGMLNTAFRPEDDPQPPAFLGEPAITTPLNLMTLESPVKFEAASGLLKHKAFQAGHKIGSGLGAMSPSPLARSSRPDSAETSPLQDRSHPFPARLHRSHTVVATTQPVIAEEKSNEDGTAEPADGEEEEQYTDERARNVITGRLIHGHLVDDDYPSPAMSAMTSSMHTLHRVGSVEDDPPADMMQSFVSTTSSYRPDGGFAPSEDTNGEEDDDEEGLQEPEPESTITVVGNVRDRPVLIVDDIMDKSGSWIAAAETVVKRGGATTVYCMATHALFGSDSLREMDECDAIDCIVVTNAFPIPLEKTRGIRKLVVLDVSNLLAEAIRRNHHGESISQLCEHFD